MDPDPYAAHDYNPIQQGGDWRGKLRRLAGPIVGGGIALAKWTFVLVKFGSIFIAVGGYALLFGWKYAVGLVLLILVHELGHYIEAKREGLNPHWPVFIPFVLAYVKYTRGNPWQTARVALAGPMLGGVAALVCYLVARANGSALVMALAYFGFFLNLLNLIPIGFFDGGAIWRSAKWLRQGGGGSKALVIYGLYFGTAVALAIGMYAAYAPQHRL